MKYVILGGGGILVLLVLGLILSPRPLSKLIYKLFDGGMAVPPSNFKEIEANTYMYKDLSYNSKYPQGKLDIIIKKDREDKMPVVFWVHGGGFVGGDKEDIREYGVQIANEGFIFVNLNYGLAPDNHYPTPLLQLAEAYKYIFINKDRYNIDMDRSYFGGDSAGAQIVGQFVNAQVDEEYRRLTGLEKVVSPGRIKGAILLCGPYDLGEFREIDNRALNFIVQRIGWAYMGEKNWLNGRRVGELSLIDHISFNYPPTFITDGNFLSFQEQGMELARTLRSKGVLVQEVFYPNREELVHNYQFMMDLEESKNTFDQLREFLNISKNI